MISERLLAWFLSRVPKVDGGAWPHAQLLLGHRGARARAPENTLPSFELAMQLGANGVEFDVFLSKDSVPVVIHDDTLERTTNGDGKVCDKTLAALQALDAANGWPEFNGAFIPTLTQVLDAMPSASVVNIELKGEGDFSKKKFVELVLETINASRDRLFIIVSSFDTKLLEILREADASIKIGFLVDENDWGYVGALISMKKVRPDSLHIRTQLATPRIIALAHEKGLRVLVWTVNDDDVAKELYAIGVDGIFSDMP